MKIKGTIQRMWIAVPGTSVYSPYEVDITQHPFVAIAHGSGLGWKSGFSSMWVFYVEGIKTDWDNLPDELRMIVRTTSVWDGKVKDYWEGLGYKDDSWYTLEVLEQL